MVKQSDFKMPGDEWQKHTSSRDVIHRSHPGINCFLWAENSGNHEWNFSQSLDCKYLLQYPIHKGLQDFVKKLNLIFKEEKHFSRIILIIMVLKWIEANDEDNSIYVFLRKGKSEEDVLMTVLNLTPGTFDYKIGIEEGNEMEGYFEF